MFVGSFLVCHPPAPTQNCKVMHEFTCSPHVWGLHPGSASQVCVFVSCWATLTTHPQGWLQYQKCTFWPFWLPVQHPGVSQVGPFSRSRCFRLSPSSGRSAGDLWGALASASRFPLPSPSGCLCVQISPICEDSHIRWGPTPLQEDLSLTNHICSDLISECSGCQHPLKSCRWWVQQRACGRRDNQPVTCSSTKPLPSPTRPQPCPAVSHLSDFRNTVLIEGHHSLCNCSAPPASGPQPVLHTALTVSSATGMSSSPVVVERLSPKLMSTSVPHALVTRACVKPLIVITWFWTMGWPEDTAMGWDGAWREWRAEGETRPDWQTDLLLGSFTAGEPGDTFSSCSPATPSRDS